MLQLTAFAHEIRTFDSLEECHPENKNFASQFFGCDVFNKGKNAQHPTCATIVGHVMEVELKTNEITGKRFYWVLIRTACDMKIDVVIHPSLPGVVEKPPKVGGVIRGFFWLSGFVMLNDDGSE